MKEKTKNTKRYIHLLDNQSSPYSLFDYMHYLYNNQMTQIIVLLTEMTNYLPTFYFSFLMYEKK